MWAAAVLVATKACGRGGFCGRMERASGRGWQMFVVVAGGCGWCAGRCVERLQLLCRKVEASPETRLPAHFTEVRKGSRGQVGNAEDGRGVCLPLPAGKKRSGSEGRFTFCCVDCWSDFPAGVYGTSFAAERLLPGVGFGCQFRNPSRNRRFRGWVAA